MRLPAAIVLATLATPAAAQVPASPRDTLGAISLYAFSIRGGAVVCEVEVSARSHTRRGFALVAGTVELRRSRAPAEVAVLSLREIPAAGPRVVRLMFIGACEPRMEFVVLRITHCIDDDGASYSDCGARMSGTFSGEGGTSPILFTGR